MSSIRPWRTTKAGSGNLAKKALDPFVTYYQRELFYLRNASTSFAVKHPKIARRLELGQGESSDPHVERLLESFAYLTANLQREVDDKFPRISTALLGILYPHFTSPLPAMTIAKFQIEPKKGKLTAAIPVAKGSPLFARSAEGPVCNFRTCYDLKLWPITVSEAEFIPVDSLEISLRGIRTDRVLRLRIESLTEPLNKLNIDSLRIYINGDRPTQNAIYEMLFTQAPTINIMPDNTEEKTAFLGGTINPVGFSSDELMLQFNEPCHPAYTLLYEYFNFANKFLFFDLQINCAGADKYCDIYLSVPDQIKNADLTLGGNNFLLNCVPIINLFTKVSEPLRMNFKAAEYLLSPDYRKEQTTEIHSITDVYAVEAETAKEIPVAPYFSYNHFENNRQSQSFWSSRRIPTTIADAVGTDVLLSFIDFNFNPTAAVDGTIYAKLLCTNRGLANSLSMGSILEMEGAIPATITCLDKPTKQYYPPEDGETQWRLVSQLAVNHLSLITGKDGTAAFKELLGLYDNLTEVSFVEEIEDISKIETREIVRQVKHSDWRGFATGTHIDLTMKQESFSTGGALLFASVLNEFFALYTTINSFTELSLKVKDQKGEWKRWKPHLGDKFLI